jgi:hypothetical protein
MMKSTGPRAAVVAVLLACGNAALADTTKPLKTEIDAYIRRIETSTGGRLRWDGADTFDVKTNGDTATATITNAHLSFRKKADDQAPVVSIILDRLEIRRAPASSANLTEYAISFPPLTTISGSDGTDVAISLTDARTTAVLEAPGDRQRAASLTLGGGRVEQKDGKNWARIGAITSSWKIVPGDNGSYRAPIDFDLKGFEIFAADAPLTVGIDHVGYSGEAAGSSLVELDAMRDRLADIRDQDSPDQKIAAWLAVLPKIFVVFGSSHAELTVEGVTAKKSDTDTQMSLKKAVLGGELTGLDGDKASIRLTVHHDGLTIAPALVPDVRVPRQAAIDLSLDDIATSALRTLAEAASDSAPNATDEQRQKAKQQMLVAALTVSPVLRLREASVEFKDVKISATGEAKRAPPMPIGYSATADIAVRGFDALSEIVTGNLGRAYLPLLKFIGPGETDADGTPVSKFHLASAFGQTLTVNGSNLSAWLDSHVSSGPGPGQPRMLHLADPPMNGDDVRAVQKALGTGQKGLADGVYDGATALAVAHFQKDAGLNVDGVVDAKTREKLGIAPPPAPPGPPKN